MIAEIRRVLSGKPSANAWWKLVAFLEQTEEDERELAMSYVTEHLKRSRAWKMASVPCGAWPEESVGWSLSTVTKESVKSFEDVGMVWCPAGNFLMGTPKGEARHSRDEEQHSVELKQGFWMAQTSVTQALFEQVMDYNPSYFQNVDKNFPVENICWDEASAFCNKLSQMEGLEEVYDLKGEGRDVVAQTKLKYQGKSYYKAEGYRLPTEAEWEYACRAGSQATIYTGVLSLKEDDEMYAPELHSIAWFGGSRENRATHLVGRLKPNVWGLYDMLGNVWEWTYDIWRKDYEALSHANPIAELEEFEVLFGIELNERPDRVNRGGSWINIAWWCRAAFRGRLEPSYRDNYLGFRFLRGQNLRKDRRS